MNSNHLLERNSSLSGHAIPRLPSTHVQVIQAMQIMILHMPSKPTKHHSHIHHRRSDPWNLLLHELQQRPISPRHPSHIPSSLSQAHTLTATTNLALLRVQWHESRAGHVVGILNPERLIHGGFPVKGLDFQSRKRRRFLPIPIPTTTAATATTTFLQIRFLKRFRFGLEFLKRVPLAALPNGPLHGSGLPRAEPDLLLPGRECGGGFRVGIGVSGQ